jgi:hypothetical protein
MAGGAGDRCSASDAARTASHTRERRPCHIGLAHGSALCSIAIVLQQGQRQSVPCLRANRGKPANGRAVRPFWRGTALVVLAAFCFVAVLAGSPCLHEVFHGDRASSPGHECAVTLLAQGGVAVSHPTAILWQPAQPALATPRLIEVPPFVGDVRLSSGRAPPALAS